VGRALGLGAGKFRLVLAFRLATPLITIFIIKINLLALDRKLSF